LNPDSYAAASTAIGGDDVRTQLFWDATPNTATPAANYAELVYFYEMGVRKGTHFFCYNIEDQYLEFSFQIGRYS
jgi:hypothetical protein